MRRTAIAALLAFAVAGLVVSAALPKEANVELSSTPAGIHPGDPWNPTITVFLENDRLATEAPPVLTLKRLGTGEIAEFVGKPTGEPGKYTVRVIFPAEGRYSYDVYDPSTGRTYPFPVVLIASAGPADAGVETPKPAATAVADSGSFPLWPVLAGGLAALAAAGAGAGLLRARRAAAAR